MSKNPMTNSQIARQRRLSTLTKAPMDRLTVLWNAYGAQPRHDLVRPAETGTVMVRGRVGAIGSAFNLGETTVTRCSVRLEDGTLGHGYVQGRDKTAARTIALIDALAEAGEAARIDAEITTPLVEEAAARKAARAARAAATKVEFFTMVRGEG